ncbi:MAG: MBL fold metallo-hydrolase [Chloroflexi bacterium]|nr:MAG: MBL fold metallo-hydrolase [Chloroflexota bacterium]
MPKARELILSTSRGKADLKLGSIFFIGTATTLIRYGGFTILTDPNFLHRHERVRLGYGLRSKRLTDPALDIEELPPVDLVVLSHYHEDHFDRVAEQKLDKWLPIVTTKHAAAALTKQGFQATYPVNTWESQTFVKGSVRLRVTSMPGEHGPGIISRLLPPVMGSVLDFETTNGAPLLRLYITGDTLIHRKLKQIPKRYPNIDLALLHLGGTRALGILVTMDDKQGVEAIRIINPTLAIPIHYNDYTVFKSPLSDFQRSVREAGLEDRVRYLSHGETYTFQVPQSRIRQK